MVSRDSPAGRRTRASAGALVLATALSGALAGSLTALLDLGFSLGALAQYLPSVGGKLTLLLHLALSYGLAGGLLGGALGALILALRDSALPCLLRGHEALGRERVKSLLVVGIPLLAIAAAIVYFWALQMLIARRHLGLMIVSSIAMAWLATFAALVATFIAAAAVERPFSKLAKSISPLAVAGVAMLLTGCAVSLLWYRVLSAVPARVLLLCGGAVLALISTLAWLGRNRSRPLQSAPRVAVDASAHVVVLLPLLAASLLASYSLAARSIDLRPPLLIASAMAIASLALCAALVLGTALATRLATVLDAPSEGWRTRLHSPFAPALLACLLLTIAGAAAAILFWPTLRLLQLRPFVVALLMFTVFVGLRSPGLSLAARCDRSAPALRAFAVLLMLALAFVLLLVSGANDAVRKAQVLHTGLGEPLAKVYRLSGDWDRDGYSRWLGGGDCDDSDPYVHPNAEEIPGDGIDNNCNAGDVSARSASATSFAELPDALPEDFNVLLISIDTIRADHLGAYGYPRNTTPNLDKLAAGGTLFLNGWAHAPSTRYSIPALLTGRHPLNVRYFDIPRQWPGLAEENLTIAEVLKARGLQTGAILNYWYFDLVRKMNQGFDHYDNENKRLHHPVAGEGPAKTTGSSSKEQTDKAIAYVAQRAAERFFLWVHYYDPHYDYETHQDAPRFGNTKIDQYDHEIAFTDLHIGRLIEDLKARGLYDKTVIVVTGDHGEGFGEHGIDLHGYHLYAAQTKVPLIIRVPGTEASVVQTPASHVDILPTLANLSGYPSSAEMLGRSLLGFITGSEDREQERYVFQQLSYENNNEYRGAVSAKCHVLFNVSPNLSWELYRIDTDPMEEHDIIDKPGECAPARAVLEAWYDDSQIPEGAVEALLPGKPEIATPLDIRFGKAIELLDFQMPATVKRGQSFSMTMTWQATGRPPPGWKVFAHFESDRGRFTGDHKPVRPFSWWRKGQYIRYSHKVTVPSSTRPGRYSLWMGTFKASERMPVQAPGLEFIDRRLKLAEIEVLP